MESQIAKLNEGHKQFAQHRGKSRPHGEAGGRDRAASWRLPPQAKEELARELARVAKDGQALNESIRGHVEKLTVEKKDFEAFDQRLRVLQAAVGEAEGRMEALSAKDKTTTQLSQRVDVAGETLPGALHAERGAQ